MDVIRNYYAGMESVDKLDLCKGLEKQRATKNQKLFPSDVTRCWVAQRIGVEKITRTRKSLERQAIIRGLNHVN